MAIKYTRGKKELEYTGFDKTMHNFGNVLEKVKSGVKKVVSTPKRVSNRFKQGQAKKEIDNISRAFGSIENYEKMYPDTKKRNDMLRKRAYNK